MVFTAAESVAFYMDDDQMAMHADTMTQLSVEGIDEVEDLADFEEESLKQVAENLRRPAGRIPDPNPPATNPNATIPTPPFQFGAKTQTRLLATSHLMRFYVAIGREINAANVQWINIGKNFAEQWKAIVASKKETQPEVPTISKALPIIKWIEVFADHLYRCIGGRNIPLAYVIRENVVVPAVCPPLAVDQPYSTEHGSVSDDLINRGSHTHGLFAKDNSDVYFKLEEATRGTSYADSIKPFQRQKDGRAAHLALVGQFAGNDKWEAIIKKMSTLLMLKKWKSSQNSPLDKFVASHRNAYVQLQACAEHVEYQLPNAHSRVGYILEAIESDDAQLQAAMANVIDDTGPGGKRGDFEAAVAYILPKDPVVRRKHDTSSGKHVEFSEANVADFGTKPAIGKTGVHLRYHTGPEYEKLSLPQKKELREWCEADPAKRGKRTGPGKAGGRASDPSKRPRSGKAAMAAASKKGVEESLAERQEQATTEEEAKTYLLSVVQTAVSEAIAGGGKKAAAASTGSTTAAAPFLRGILKNAKRG